MYTWVLKQKQTYSAEENQSPGFAGGSESSTGENNKHTFCQIDSHLLSPIREDQNASTVAQ